MLRSWFAPVALLTLAPSVAFADTVALVPAANPEDVSAQARIEADVTSGLEQLGHNVVAPGDVAGAANRLAAEGTIDGPANEGLELVEVGRAVSSTWTIYTTVTPAVTSSRVELTAAQIETGRVETVAREVDNNATTIQVREMLEVLVRPEGVGVEALPWETVAVPLPPPPEQQPPPQSQVVVTAPPVMAPPPPPETGPKRIKMDYAFDSKDVWPPYSAGHPFYVAVGSGFNVAVGQPDGAEGDAASLVALARLGYAPGDLGLEVFGQVGGNIVGVPVVYVDAGVRWMLTPSAMDGDNYAGSFHIGPEVYGGAFFRLGQDVDGPGGVVLERPGETTASLGGAVAMAFGVTDQFQVETHLGNLRWISLEAGSVVLVGGTIAAAGRF